MVDTAPEIGWIKSNGLALRFLGWGAEDAPAIVMLHGLRSYAYTWAPIAETLMRDWRVIALDQRGRGESDWDPQGNYSTQAYVDDLAALVDHLKLGRFVLLGHSMGGTNGIIYAASHPDRVTALVIEDMGPGASYSSLGSERIKRDLGRNVRVEGLPVADWVLIDADDVIVHLFRPEVRSFYNLERMWAFEESKPAAAAGA